MIGNFASLGLKGGVWEGALHIDEPPARIALTLSGRTVGLAEVEPEGEGLWRIRARVPVETLAEGMQTYMLIADDGEGLEAPRPGARRVGYLPLLAVVPLAGLTGTVGLLVLWLAFAGGYMTARALTLGLRERSGRWVVLAAHASELSS